MLELKFKTIIERIRQTSLPSYDLVIGIAEGGIVPASLIAAKINTELRTVRFNYRDEKNQPVYEEPQLLSHFILPENIKNILLVDDVSVTGKTLITASHFLKDFNVQTLVLKGKADFVLFPEIESCVKWPWKFNSLNS